MTYAISVVLCTKNDMAHQTNKYETGDTGFDMDLKNAQHATQGGKGPLGRSVRRWKGIT